MSTLCDRLLLFAISILLIVKNQVDYVMVCLILAVIITETMIMYVRQKKTVLFICVVFLIVSFFVPKLTAFYPLLVYECVLSSIYPVIPVQFLLAVLTYVEKFEYRILSKEIYGVLIFMVMGIVWGIKAKKAYDLSEKVHNLQDEESYLLQKNKKSHEELVIKQDTEIHAATLAERNRIAREIHDHVGHMLSRSILQLGAILAINKEEKMKAPLNDLKITLDTAMNNIRESVHDLKDDSVDLEYMVKDMVKQYDNLTIEIDYDMSPYLSKELKYCLVAIIKESLTNTIKHSDSTRVIIVMREHPALYQILIEDNGSKSKEAIKALENVFGKHGIGLENIRERVNAFQGNVRFSGDNGFKIFISIPKKQRG